MRCAASRAGCPCAAADCQAETHWSSGSGVDDVIEAHKAKANSEHDKRAVHHEELAPSDTDARPRQP
eukprot:4562161-Amphidinium_carterae.1